MFKKTCLILALAVTVFIVPGCTLLNSKKQRPHLGGASEGAGSLPVTETSPAKTTVVYARGLDETDAALKIIEEFNKQSETVNVKYQELPYDETERYSQIKRWLSSGDSSIDIFDINMTWCAEFAQSGYTVNLDGYIESSGADLLEYNKAVVDGCKFNGSLWAMPRIISTGLFFYRRDITGAAPPTWDDFIESAKTQKGGGGTKYGYVFSGKISESLVTEAMEFIYSYGGKILDLTGEVVINSPQSANGLNKLYEIYNGDFVPDTEYKMTEIDACISFLNGESVYMRNVPSAWSVLNSRDDSKVRGKFLIGSLPAGSAGSYTVLDGYASVVSSASKKQDEALEFIKFISGYEGQRMLSVYSGRIPAMISVLDDPDVISANPHFSHDTFRNTLDTAMPNIISPHYKTITGVIQDELYLFLTGKKQAEFTLNTIETKLKLLLH